MFFVCSKLFVIFLKYYWVQKCWFLQPQDPGYLGDRVINASKEALSARYTMLPYLYTLFYKSHTEGSTVARPLVHEWVNRLRYISVETTKYTQTYYIVCCTIIFLFRFSTDANTWDIDRQFLWGAALLISPILDEVKEASISYVMLLNKQFLLTTFQYTRAILFWKFEWPNLKYIISIAGCNRIIFLCPKCNMVQLLWRE